MVERRQKKKKAQLPFRTNIIFFIIFILFSVMILQLGVVQILNGESFQDEIDRTIQDRTSIPVPRGKMLDTHERLVVDNKPLYSITYTPPKGTQADERLKLAEDLSKFISMDSEEELNKINDHDKREYLYLKDLVKNEGLPEEEHEEYFVDRIPEEKLKDLSNTEVYRETLNAITDEEIDDKNFTTEELEVIRIKKELDQAYSLTPQIVKNEGVTPEEYALVSEHLDELPGINATTDWDREYNYGSTLRMLLGNVTSHTAGIPGESADYYLTRGYSRNDRVGISGLEQQYEEVLRGRKEQIEYTTTKSGIIVDSETIVSGQRGKDLILTIDMEFQEKVDKILQEELEAAINLDRYNNRYLTDAIAVAMDPQTGELLAVSGQTYDHENREIQNRPDKALLASYEPGSTVKGATVLAGLHSGVISPGEVFYDEPIDIQGTPTKRSLNPNIGSTNEIKALQMSSNVYMFYIALRMGGDFRYRYPQGTPTSASVAALDDLRNYFKQLGLGAPTGIDYPSEEIGVIGRNPFDPGILLDFAIGQYDTYTTLQLAQYVSTIANDGYRTRPHFVKEIRDPIQSLTELGPVYKSTGAEYMNRVQMSDSELNRVQEGFRQAFQVRQGTGYSYFHDKDYDPVGKTGTAESSAFDTDEWRSYDTLNRSLVGYAPQNDPEIAIAVMVPHIGINAEEDGNVANKIAERIFDAYFDLEEDEEDEDDKDDETDD